MGIYDREYYRGDTRGSLWFSGVAPVCRAIIIANVAVFLLEQTGIIHRDDLFNWFAARGKSIFLQGHLWELLTATFLHFNFFHLLGNMLILWFVGREMEAMYGSKDFAALYFSAAIVSTLGWAAIDAFRGGPPGEMIGASGAVCAVMILYALYYPRREILVMFVIPIEVWLLVTLYVGYDLLLFLRPGDGNIAVESHLVGAAYGYLYKRFDLRWSHLNLPWGWGRPRRRFRVISPEPREKPSARPSVGSTWSSNVGGTAKPSAAPASSSIAVVAEEQLDARLDEVLAKIAREGRGGLTDDENRVLQEASVRARNRRSDRV